MTPIELDNETRNRLRHALFQTNAKDLQLKLFAVMNHAIYSSNNSDDLLAMLRQGQEAFSDAIVVVMSELNGAARRIEPAKGNIKMDSRKAQ